MPKRTYYTKCGREFQKSSTAEVTGYELKENQGVFEDTACVLCPFPVEVKEGWPPVHKRWECRAGSMPPNHNTEWRGSLDDKNTMQILSLDAPLMEEMRQFCEAHPDLLASFNADSSADCRRSLSIGCSSNKKGLSAKKEFIEKFFSGKTAAPKSKERCSTCGHNVDNGDQLAGHIYCDYKKRLMHEESEACSEFEPKEEISTGNGSAGNRSDVLEAWENGEIDEQGNQLNDDDTFDNGQTCRICGCTDNHSCEGGCYWIQEDLCSACACDESECPFNDSNGGCNFQNEDPASEGYNDDVIKAADEIGCPKDDVLIAYKAITDPDSCDVPKEPEKKTPRIGSERGCIDMVETCPYFCKHNDGCGILLTSGNARESAFKVFGAIECDIYSKYAPKHETANEMPQNENEALEITNDQHEIEAFDYSSVDQDTADFLIDKAQRITEIRIRSVFAIGKELKDAQDRLANHYQGSFGKWLQSIGISRQTAQNYIQGFEYVVKNFDNIESADQIQPSLLFAISKPSAPAELQQAVLAGDITTHKEYQELLQKLKDTEKARYDEKSYYETAHKVRMKEILELEQQVDQARHNGNPEKVKELGKIISDKQQEIEELKDDRKTLNDEIITLRKQLKDKPIEASAVKIEEKYIVPSEVKNSIFNKVIGLYEGLRGLTSAEIQIFADGIDPVYQEEVIQALNAAVSVLNKIETAVWKYTS